MVKSEIISKLSKKLHPKLKKSDLEKILNTLINTIIDGIKENKSCELRKFGRFSPKIIKGRVNARNPKSGQIIQTKDKNSISFKMSKELMNEINTKEREVN